MPVIPALFVYFIVYGTTSTYYKLEGKGTITKIEGTKFLCATLDNNKTLALGQDDMVIAKIGDTIEKKANSYIYKVNDKEINILVIAQKRCVYICLVIYVLFFCWCIFMVIDQNKKKKSSVNKRNKRAR